MNEKLLQLIWQYQLFNAKHLTTIDNRPIQIIKTGTLNNHQGADFLHSRIRIDEQEWIGNVEIDMKTSFWKKHHHHTNSDFKNIILHIVWENDTEATHSIPILELKHKVSKWVIERYQQFFETKLQEIPCSTFLKEIPILLLQSWKERLLIERLTQKSNQFLENVRSLKNDWETAFWQCICSYFGMQINKEIFLEIAKSIPVRVWMRERLTLTHIEALLFGQAGLLEKISPTDEYVISLKKEYHHLRIKHQLIPITMKLKFLRTRPANFPTIRLAQLATLIFNSQQLFQFVLQNKSPKEMVSWLQIPTSSYWDTHYVLGESSPPQPKMMGKDMCNRIIVNVIYPSLFAYAHYHHNTSLQEYIINQMNELQEEQNHIIEKFESKGLLNSNATDSQAFIQLYNYYCTHKKCLECHIGKYILTKAY